MPGRLEDLYTTPDGMAKLFREILLEQLIYVFAVLHRLVEKRRQYVENTFGWIVGACSLDPMCKVEEALYRQRSQGNARSVGSDRRDGGKIHWPGLGGSPNWIHW